MKSPACMPAPGVGMTVAVAVALALACASAQAVTTVEIEPNNTAASAQLLAGGASDLVVEGFRSFADPSDDFFSFDVPMSGLLSIVSSSAEGMADSIMGLYGPGGLLLASNDDGPGLGSMMSSLSVFIAPGQTGRYTLGFSGFNPGLLACTATVTECYDTTGDFMFDTFVAGGGSGGSTGWDYRIDLSGAALVPEPGALALLGVGLPLLLAWKRRGRG